MKKYLILLIVCLFLMVSNLYPQEDKQIKILLLSGRNNHEWQQTTPFIEKLFVQSGRYSVSVTDKPDTLKMNDFQKFDAVLNNWNSWPENELRWPVQTENALLQFIKDGGGFVTFHASSSAFYKWPEFHEISTAAWIMDTTSHGQVSETNVSIINKKHPVTAGIKDFIIFDELWLNAEVNPKFEVLGTASNKITAKDGIKPQPAIMVAGYGKGRIFHTILGHNIEAMESEAFQILLLRGVEWAASGKVSQKN